MSQVRYKYPINPVFEKHQIRNVRSGEVQNRCFVRASELDTNYLVTNAKAERALVARPSFGKVVATKRIGMVSDRKHLRDIIKKAGADGGFPDNVPDWYQIDEVTDADQQMRDGKPIKREEWLEGMSGVENIVKGEVYRVPADCHAGIFFVVSAGGIVWLSTGSYKDDVGFGGEGFDPCLMRDGWVPAEPRLKMISARDYLYRVVAECSPCEIDVDTDTRGKREHEIEAELGQIRKKLRQDRILDQAITGIKIPRGESAAREHGVPTPVASSDSDLSPSVSDFSRNPSEEYEIALGTPPASILQEQILTTIKEGRELKFEARDGAPQEEPKGKREEPKRRSSRRIKQRVIPSTSL